MSTVDRAKISLRVSTYLWMDTPRRADLLDMLRQYRDTIDEVAFFTGFTHPPLPLTVIRERAAILAEIIPQFRALGLSTGINHLATMGHLDENLPNSLNEPWQKLVDADGSVSPSCYCAADPGFQQYAADAYFALAQTRPDFIWVDDDVRMESHPGRIRFACFCDRCIADFSAKTGAPSNRESLRAGFSMSARPYRLRLRLQWLEHNRQYIADLLALIRKAVDRVSPQIQLGFMTAEIPYSGFGHASWAAALGGPQRTPVKWRPGGGFYTDRTPADLLGKAHLIGRETARLPGTITDIQSEHENFPYQRLHKSVTVFKAEIAAYIGAGCAGTALNCMGISQDPFEEYMPYFAGVRAGRKFYGAAVATFGRSPCEGVWPAWTADHFALLNPDGDWLSAPGWGADLNSFIELSELGIPMAYARGSASITLLSGDTCLEFSEDELQKVLAGGVLMDGPALARLNAMGHGELTGFTVAAKQERDTIERLSPDAINGAFAGWHRDCRPSFWLETTHLLAPSASGARPLSEIIDFTPSVLGIGSGAFENRLGGRVAVMGYYPWRALASLAKTSQLKALVRWLSRDSIPAYVDSYAKAAIWCRRDADGRPALMLLNASIDPAQDLAICIRNGPPSLSILYPDGRESRVPRSRDAGAYGCYVIDRIGPWEPVLLRQGQGR